MVLVNNSKERRKHIVEMITLYKNSIGQLNKLARKFPDRLEQIADLIQLEHEILSMYSEQLSKEYRNALSR